MTESVDTETAVTRVPDLSARRFDDSAPRSPQIDAALDRILRGGAGRVKVASFQSSI